MTASNADEAITFRTLKDSVVELFNSNDEIALFYFAGHGHLEATGGYICGSGTVKANANTTSYLPSGVSASLNLQVFFGRPAVRIQAKTAYTCLP